MRRHLDVLAESRRKTWVHRQPSVIPPVATRSARERSDSTISPRGSSVADPEIIRTFPGKPHYRERVVLDGQEFVLTLRWSMREERFYLDVADVNGSLLVGAIKVVANWPLLDDVRGSGIAIPRGEIFAHDLRSAPVDPGLDDLGDTIALVYAPAELLEEYAAEAAA